MTIMLAPPGRTSVSALCLVQGLGANHCLISSGSVHALYTFSRGALMMRVSTSSRSAVVAALSAVVMLFSPFICGGNGVFFFRCCLCAWAWSGLLFLLLFFAHF